MSYVKLSNLHKFFIIHKLDYTKTFKYNIIHQKLTVDELIDAFDVFPNIKLIGARISISKYDLNFEQILPIIRNTNNLIITNDYRESQISSHLSANGMIDTIIKNTPNLKSLTIDCVCTLTISVITHLKKLKTIIFKLCSLLNFDSIHTLPNLQHICLENCRLQQINDLYKCHNLRKFNLKVYNPINFPQILPFTKLRSFSYIPQQIHMNNISLTYTPSFAPCTNLQIIDLGGNTSLTDISSISYLTHLTRLNLHYCTSLHDISSLSSCLQLKWLKLQSCRSISSISVLSSLHNLERIFVADCPLILSIEPLYTCNNLKVIYVSINRNFVVDETKFRNNVEIKQWL